MAVKADFEATFQTLRGVLKKHAKDLTVAEDKPGRYCLDAAYDPKRKRRLAFAAVIIMKNYVSFHLLPLYMSKEMKAAVSDKLRVRMQGMACFNFQTIEPAMVKELAALTARGLKGFKKLGYL